VQKEETALACHCTVVDEKVEVLMRTACIVRLSKLQISELNTLVQKETSGDVEGNLLHRTVIVLQANTHLPQSRMMKGTSFGIV
jgi:hypothetical protein